MTDITDMTNGTWTPITAIDALKSELEEVSDLKERIEADLAAAIEGGKTDLAKEFIDIIIARGYDPLEIVEMMAPTKNREQKERVYQKYSYLGNTYSRGPLPVWMKHAMIGKGLDPVSADDRSEFKSLHMTAVD